MIKPSAELTFMYTKHTENLHVLADRNALPSIIPYRKVQLPVPGYPEIRQ